MDIKKAKTRRFNERTEISKSFLCYTVEFLLYDRKKKKEVKKSVSIHVRKKRDNATVIKEALKQLPAESIMIDAKIKTVVEERYLMSITDFIAQAHKVTE